MIYAAVAMMAVGTVLSFAGAQDEAANQEALGRSQKLAADHRATQMAKKAGQERAVAQRQAGEERRKTEIVRSNLQARAAASGGDTLDPGIVSLDLGIVGEGEFRALNALFTGESKAVDLEFGAELERFGGEQGLTASKMAAQATRRRATASLLTGIGSTGLLAAGAIGGGSGDAAAAGAAPPTWTPASSATLYDRYAPIPQ